MAEQNKTAGNMGADMLASTANIDAWASIPGSEIRKIEDVANPDFIKGYKNMPKQLGFSSAPRMYLAEGRDILIEARETQEGEPVLIVGKKFLELRTDEALSVLPHELKHYKNGDTKADNIAKILKSDNLAEKIELDADQALQRLCDPSRAANVIAAYAHLSGDVAFQETRKKIILDMPTNSEGCIEIFPNSSPVGKKQDGLIR